jgi:antitoxin component HigA of HigAB toxin-antitoxin module
MTDEIKKRIKLLGLKKSHVAEKIGAKPSEFSHFLSGNRRLNEDKLFKLKTYLGLN